MYWWYVICLLYHIAPIIMTRWLNTCPIIAVVYMYIYPSTHLIHSSTHLIRPSTHLIYPSTYPSILTIVPSFHHLSWSSIHPSIVSHPSLWPTYQPSTVPSRYGTVMMRIASIRSPGCMKDMVRRWMACLFIHLVSSMPTSRQMTLWWSYHGDAAGGDGGDDDDDSDDHYDDDGIRFDHHGGSDADEDGGYAFNNNILWCIDFMFWSHHHHLLYLSIQLHNACRQLHGINSQWWVALPWYQQTDMPVEGRDCRYWLIHTYMMVVIVDIDRFIYTWW